MRARDQLFAFLIYDLHYSYSDLMELPLVVFRDLLEIYDRQRVRSEIASMHADLRRMLKR